MIESDLRAENHSGCSKDDEWWGKEQKLSYELEGQLRPNIMVARTMEEAMEMERRESTIWIGQ